ncbi:hypothetical protein LIX60_05095 [Streptomyces sp. S07_1.15]|uniref:hypothetical protein n=1 Tax=Streptomyces sp. S07_1.15 TaxID=2873925 RepID=UPI001D142F12|nr:hypothetical protein [Streptomyces sp. S07_1.15]MCC3650862.1 hypothetical protein [Streptomyces sp. S07_1.15]
MYRTHGMCHSTGLRRAALTGAAALTALALTAGTASALPAAPEDSRSPRDAQATRATQNPQGAEASRNPQSTRAARGRTVSFRTHRAGAYFYHFREKLVVSDYKADGYGARAYLTWGSRRASVYAGGGRNSTDEKDLRIKEGTPVWLQLCTTKRGKNLRCTKTRKGYA